MTKPRDNPNRELFGILGSLPNMSVQKKWWNSRFALQDIDAFLDHYPTKPEQLQERLSEMFHFDRRGYILGNSLCKAIIPLLDQLDFTAEGEGRANMILNNNGVFIGYFLEKKEDIWNLWLEKRGVVDS